ncbi:DUF6049 family protein [Nocardioides sp. Arc9.136]|uniref:DUF6049 family protein n=1 Tax=Nocardioides sp. Arc9.136 TaxID=2996826 RepID=UPI002665DCF4|nr:DUF6049 family protein [Nocardioides sp. Arc9.136]WKN48532.1 DUF6049 family protein [Nocardioides sp. Arc9.136]
MLRPRSPRPALVAAALALVGLGAGTAVVPAPADAAGAPVAVSSAATSAVVDDEAALEVTIDSLTPGAIPRRGPIRVSGSVTNRSGETWRRINLYPFLGETPMTTSEQLAAAATVPAGEYVGGRITDVSDTIEELEPGGSQQFSIRLPRAYTATRTAPGVYWFGVHASGESSAGRDDVADGRARTFLPLVPRSTRGQVETAVVVPLRRALTREPDGSLADVPGWIRTLGSEGSLRSLVDLGASAGDRPVTWLVDPALVDAVRRLAAGNPPRSLAPTLGGQPIAPSDQPDAAFSSDPSASASADEDGEDGENGQDGEQGEGDGQGGDGEPVHEPTAEEAEAAQVASAWLGRLSEAMEGDDVLALPYGDLDVAGALTHDPDLLTRARARAEEATSSWEVATSPALGSPTGFLDPAAVVAADPDTTMLVTDRELGADAPGVAKVRGHRLVVTSSGAAAGGPGPDDPLAAVSLRQRVLAEAAVRLLGPGRKPLVVQLPTGWSPSSTTGFFDGLDEDWVDVSTVGDVAGREGTAVALDDLDYPERQVRQRLDEDAFEAATGLIEAGEVLQHVLRDNTRVAAEVADEGLASLSYSSRDRPTTARLAVLGSRQEIDGLLGSVVIEAPRGVALSSASGGFGASVVNGLDEPVEVSIEAVTDDPAAVSITGPETIEVPARGRTPVLLDATTREPGVHRVRLVLTDHTEDPDDRHTPLGSTDELSIRSIQASAVIWVIMGVGALLLFSAIAVRLVRRVRRARREEEATT